MTLGWVLAELGQSAEASRTIQQAMSNGNVSADASYHAAQVLYDNGLTTAAQKILEPTLQSGTVFPSRPAAQQLLSKIRS